MPPHLCPNLLKRAQDPRPAGGLAGGWLQGRPLRRLGSRGMRPAGRLQTGGAGVEEAPGLGAGAEAGRDSEGGAGVGGGVVEWLSGGSGRGCTQISVSRYICISLRQTMCIYIERKIEIDMCALCENECVRRGSYYLFIL